MFFLARLTFIFRSWISEAGGDGKLQGRLLEDSKHQDMTFPVGSTFIFISWICEADGDGKLQGRLLKNSEHHEAHAVSATTAEQLTKRISQLTMSDPTQISQMTNSDSNLDSAFSLESHPSSLYDGPSPFPFGLCNTAASYQALLHPSSLYDDPSLFSFGLHNMAASYQALLQDSASPI
jgi:hypothetical protein